MRLIKIRFKKKNNYLIRTHSVALKSTCVYWRNPPYYTVELTEREYETLMSKIREDG